jgi:hypothetical protein
MGEFDAQGEAVRRYSSRLIEDYDGDRYDEDEHGYDATARAAFVAGAEWQASRPITDAQAEVIARYIFAASPEGLQGWKWPAYGWHRQRDMERARTALERALAARQETNA